MPEGDRRVVEDGRELSVHDRAVDIDRRRLEGLDEHLDLRAATLDPARRLRLRRDRPPDLQDGFPVRGLKLLYHGRVVHDDLSQAATVAEDDEADPAEAAEVVEPPSQQDRFADMAFQV